MRYSRDILTGRNSPGQRAAFTLVELLVTIVIIGILAAMVGVVALGAGQASRQGNTRSLIAKIHPLVIQQYDTYRSRRAPLNPSVESAINQATQGGAARRSRGQMLAEARLYALRELMLLEMPDRWSDVLFNAVTNPPANVVPGQPVFLQRAVGAQYGGATPLNEAYRRHYYGVANAINSRTGQPNTADNILDNQGAECLYMIVMFATADGEARGLFAENQIGDVDGDGAPEFLDGWGRPINFLRWAPGFESDQQLNANRLEAQGIDAWIDLADRNHDPFDLYRADPLAYALTPLIFSAGADGEYGIRTVKPAVTWKQVNVSPTGGTAVGTSGRRVFFNPRLTPFAKLQADDEGPETYLGTIRDDSATDNLHNHQTATQ